MDKYLDVFFKYKYNFKFPYFHFCNDSVGMLDEEEFKSNSLLKTTLCFTKK